MKTFIANFILPLLAWTTVCLIAGFPDGLPIGARIALPVCFTMMAYGFSQLHDRLK